MKSSVNRLPNSQIELEIELLAEEFGNFVNQAISNLGKKFEIKGFRKGNVPEAIIKEKVGKENLLAEAADLAVKDAYAKVIAENKIEPILQPEVQILKIANGSPFVFKIKVSILPEIDLADYKKIASQIKKSKISVNDEEINDSLEYIKKSRAKYSPLDRPAQEKDFVEIEYESPQLGAMSVLPQNQGNKKIKDEFILGQGGFMPGFEQKIVGMKVGEEKEFSIIFPQNTQRKDLSGKDVIFKVKMLNVKRVELPEINDDFAKGLGKFDSIQALKDNLKEGIVMEKEEQERQKRRNEILEILAEKSKFDIPQSLVDYEKENLFKNFQDKINQNYKISFHEYLASAKQDEKSVRDSFGKEAEKKVKNYLILREIGKRENISVGEDEVEQEISRTIKYYPKEVLEKIDINELKEYTKGVIYNEKVFQELEKLSPSS